MAQEALWRGERSPGSSWTARPASPLLSRFLAVRSHFEHLGLREPSLHRRIAETASDSFLSFDDIRVMIENKDITRCGEDLQDGLRTLFDFGEPTTGEDKLGECNGERMVD